MIRKILCILCVLAGCGPISMATWQAVFLPEPYLIDLPAFRGRIIDGNEVRPGTFTIWEDFKHVSSWGDDAIMTYNIRSYGKFSECIIIQAWVPDAKTTGVFRYSQRESVPDQWGWFHYIDRIEKNDNFIVAFPGMAPFPLFLALGVILILGGLIAGATYMYPN